MARRPAGRHVRRVKKRTPRRWLPFLALTALVVGAVVAEKDPARPEVRRLDEAAGVVALPTVAEVGAISSAWFCGGGTAVGDGGVAELSLVIANAESTGARAEVTVVTVGGETATTTVEVPARGRARVNTWELVQGDFVAATVEVRGGRVAVDREVAGPDGFSTGPCSTTAATSWFVPSGSTLRGAQEYLSLYNPFPDDASVDVAFDTDKGTRSPSPWTSYTVPGRSVRVLQVSDQVDDRAEVAARVTARSGRLVVDRLQTYDGSGDDVTGTEEGAVTTDAPQGLVSTAAIPSAADRWVFPGARLSPGNRTQVAVYNPSGSRAEIDVVISYEDPATVPATEPIQLDVPARRQRVLDLTDLAEVLPGQDFSIDVRSLQGVPIVAERLGFWGEDADVHGAGVAVGSPQAATRWLVVQGGPTKRRTSSVAVANLGSRDATLRVVELNGGTSTPVDAASVEVPAGDRRALDLSDVSTAATLIIESDEPVVVSSLLAAVDGRLGVSFASAAPFPEALVALPAPR